MFWVRGLGCVLGKGFRMCSMLKVGLFYSLTFRAFLWG